MNSSDKGKIVFGDNSFDLIRIFAALVVMFGHFAWKYQLFTGDSRLILVSLSTLAHYLPGVPIFFALGGYLIYGSLERSESFFSFFKKRILRIYPGIWVCTLIYAVVLVCVYSSHLNSSFFKWIFVQLFGIAYTPSCLKGFATGSVNGSLWFIMVDIELYFVAGVFYKYFKKWSKQTWLIAIVISVIASVICDYLDRRGIASKLIERSFVPYLLWFIIGLFVYRYRNELVPCLSRIVFKLFVLYTVLYFMIDYFHIDIPGYYSHIITGIMLPFIAIGSAYRLGRHRIKADITYELFLYHWLVLNLLIYYEVIGCVSLTIAFIIFFIGSILLASVMHVVNTRVNKLITNLLMKK